MQYSMDKQAAIKNDKVLILVRCIISNFDGVLA